MKSRDSVYNGSSNKVRHRGGLLFNLPPRRNPSVVSQNLNTPLLSVPHDL